MQFLLKNILALAILACASESALGQRTWTASGFVRDGETGEVLISAYVYDAVTGRSTQTNAYGYYSLTVQGDSARLQASYPTFMPALKTVRPGSSAAKTDFALMPVGVELGEVEVVAERPIQDEVQMSTVSLSMKSVKNLPVLLGETDILKAIQLMPGVQSGTEGTSGFYVRGGGPDQNLMLIDGVPVYNVNHLFGFFSVFNADAINSVDLIKGGFPANYGGRLSSVLDVRMKEGNRKEWKATGAIGLISSKLTVEGPLWKDRTSVLLSARRTYLDVLAQPLIAAQDPNTRGGYYFYDLNGKINHQINRNHQIYLSYYQGLDEAYARTSESYEFNGTRYTNTLDNSLNWGNQIATARWSWVISPQLFSNATATYSRYRFITDIQGEDREEDPSGSRTTRFAIAYLSSIEDVGGKWDFEYRPAANTTFKWGASVTQHTFEPGVSSWNWADGGTNLDTSFGSTTQRALDQVLYGLVDVSVNDRLRVNFGFHGNGFNVGSKNYLSIQPRFSARYLVSEKGSFKWSYVQMAQFLHLLANQTIGLPTDLWVPVTENVRPQEAWQTAIGYAHNLGKGWELSIEGYYKDMRNLIEYKEGATFFLGFSDWQTKVTTGRGWAYGGEFLLEKKSGNSTGWIGYTLAKTTRQFDELNFGNPFPYTYDRRHDLSVVFNHAFNDRISMGAVFVYGTGRAVTLATRKMFARPEDAFDGTWLQTVEAIDGRNSFREPAYHRADISLTIKRPNRWGEAAWQFGVYNAYNRINIFYMDFGYDDRDNRVLKGYGLFPLIPSVSYSFEF
ncbi:MAG: TonB-dependent receptor [Schleiferiaceae bacterium]